MFLWSGFTQSFKYDKMLSQSIKQNAGKKFENIIVYLVIVVWGFFFFALFLTALR